MKKPPSAQLGFTLIELIVVSTLSALLLFTTTTMLITIIQGNTRTTIRKALDDQGDEAMAQIEFVLKNSVEIIENSDEEICEENMEMIRVLTLEDDNIEFRRNSNQLIMEKNGSTTPLTSDAIDIQGNPDFDCFENTNGEKYAEVSFTLEKEITGGFQETEDLEQEFSSLIEFRNL